MVFAGGESFQPGSVVTARERPHFSADGITSSAGGLHVPFERDAQGRITQITDPAGNAYRYEYDTAGDLVRVIFPPTQADQPAPTIEYTYDPDHPHFYRSVRDPSGRTVSTNTYYASPADPPELDGRLKSVTNYIDTTTSYTFNYAYDLVNNTITTTNPDGGRVINTYAGRTLPQGNATESIIDLVSQTIDVAVDAGQVKTRTTQYAYDDNRNLAVIALPDPNTGAAVPLATDPKTCAPRNVCTLYDGNGNPIQITDALGRVRRIEYNQYNYPIREADPLGNVRESIFDANGNFLRMSDARGTLGGFTFDTHGNPLTSYIGNDPSQTTSFTYDQYGNIVTETDSFGTVTTYGDYDFFGNPRTLMRQGGDGTTRTSILAYNALGRVTQISVPLNDGSGSSMTTSLAYDQNGNQTLVRDNTMGWATGYEYNYDRSLKRVLHPDGTADSYTYTWRGQPLTETDRAGNITRYTYNLAGELVSVTHADGTNSATTTRYTYDLAGRRTGETDPNGRTTISGYDDGDRLLFVIDPVNGASHPTEYRYDAGGRLEAQINPDGTQVRYEYDVRGFPISSTRAYGTTQARTDVRDHDGLGNVTRHVDSNGKVTSYVYDAASRLLAVTDALGHTTHYTYNAFGQLETITDANNQRTTFAYDAVGRLVRKTWPDQSYEMFNYDVQPGSTPSTTYYKVSHRLTDGNVNVHYFDSQGRQVRAEFFDGRVVRYIYTATGQPREIRDPSGTVCYSYDAHNRLVEVAHLSADPNAVCGQTPSDRQVRYSYDANGNRASVTTIVGATETTTSYSYDANNRICSVSLSATSTPCGVINSSTFAYSYDDIARTRTLTHPNGVVTTATFDALGQLQRLAHTRNGQTLAHLCVHTRWGR